jgi:hypothetical protein
VNHDQELLRETNLSGRPSSSPESVGESRTAWRSPSVTIIDIKRTMLILGSVIDGISGSI